MCHLALRGSLSRKFFYLVLIRQLRLNASQSVWNRQDCQCHSNSLMVIYWCSASCNLFFLSGLADLSHVPYLEEILLIVLVFGTK